MGVYNKNKLKRESQFYIWDEPYLRKHCSNQVIRICVPQEEHMSILEHCHAKRLKANYRQEQVYKEGFETPEDEEVY